MALGVASTFGHLNPSFGATASIVGLMGVGGLAGQQIAHRVDPTSLPQTVAAFHSLVGLAASSAAIGDYLNCADTSQVRNLLDLFAPKEGDRFRDRKNVVCPSL